MRLLKAGFSSAVLAFALTGCASTPQLSQAQKTGLAPYQAKIYQACITYNETGGSFDDSTPAACTYTSETAATLMVKEYENHQADKTLNKCQSEQASSVQSCIRTEKKKYYKGASEAAIKALFPG